MTVFISCEYGIDHEWHEYPDDWLFGGSDGCDPRPDPRWMPTTYTYYDADTTELIVTQVPLCDDQALDEFTQVASAYADKVEPKWLSAKRPSEKMAMLPFTYDKRTDLLTEVVK